MISLDAATVLLQWATGGMLFCWFTTRRRIASLGYGWLLRGVYAGFAAGSFAAGVAFGVVPVREAASIGVILACLVGIAVSVKRRRAGVSGARAEHDRRTARVAAMTGIDRAGRAADDPTGAATGDSATDGTATGGTTTGGTVTGGTATAPLGPEFPPALDLVPAAIGAVGLVAAALDSAAAADSSPALALARILVGAAFIGAISDAMLLGHWYLTQPGLPRKLINEIVTALLWLWPFEVAVMVWPPGMIEVLTGSIDDGWGGMLGWIWLACTITTVVLIFVTRAALRERYYSAVMAATGFMYLAILTGFGMDIVARAVLSPS